MEEKECICRKCARKVTAEETVFHPIRTGYSAVHFPLFHFEKVPLCMKCLERQRKIDLFEKGLSLLALVIVIYFMVIGFLFLF